MSPYVFGHKETTSQWVQRAFIGNIVATNTSCKANAKKNSEEQGLSITVEDANNKQFVEQGTVGTQSAEVILKDLETNMIDPGGC